MYVTLRQKNLCVHLLGYIAGASPPLLKICVSIRWVTLFVGASPPLCVRSFGNTVGVSPPRVCPFIGRQSSLDPCMLPTPLCGIFFLTNGVPQGGFRYTVLPQGYLFYKMHSQAILNILEHFFVHNGTILGLWRTHGPYGPPNKRQTLIYILF